MAQLLADQAILVEVQHRFELIREVSLEANGDAEEVWENARTIRHYANEILQLLGPAAEEGYPPVQDFAFSKLREPLV